jgi:hypothetical protein
MIMIMMSKEEEEEKNNDNYDNDKQEQQQIKSFDINLINNDIQEESSSSTEIRTQQLTQIIKETPRNGLFIIGTLQQTKQIKTGTELKSYQELTC